MKKIALILAMLALSTTAQAEFTPRDAQKAGQDFSNSSLGEFSNPNALVQKGKSGEGIGGNEYSDTPPEGLTGQRNKGSLLTIGNDSRAGSVGKVNNQGGYSNDRANQSDEAVHFLNRQPVLKPTLSPNDPMLNPDTFSMGKTPFQSSTEKECRQVIDEKADLKEVEVCEQTYSPYIFTCQTRTSFSFARESYCPAGRKLERIVRNICSNCINPFIVLDVFCGSSRGTFEVSGWLSIDSSGDSVWGSEFFTKKVVAANAGVTQDIYLGNFGSGCNFPLYYNQACSSTTCTTAYSLRNSTCPGRDFSAPGTYDVPWRTVMTEASVNGCSAAQQIGR